MLILPSSTSKWNPYGGLSLGSIYLKFYLWLNVFQISQLRLYSGFKISSRACTDRSKYPLLSRWALVAPFKVTFFDSIKVCQYVDLYTKKVCQGLHVSRNKALKQLHHMIHIKFLMDLYEYYHVRQFIYNHKHCIISMCICWKLADKIGCNDFPIHLLNKLWRNQGCFPLPLKISCNTFLPFVTQLFTSWNMCIQYKYRAAEELTFGTTRCAYSWKPLPSSWPGLPSAYTYTLGIPDPFN